ncbi:DndE family protein [Candidatus Protofrankia californiensis]|uniref:DndE family protein n=1 Tax=Candidatus Protofrankia californiensis TaxID=1839754 RepID=UPI0010415E99|nr:DndE family protein [Candidatus Protofrankia californiensis]
MTAANRPDPPEAIRFGSDIRDALMTLVRRTGVKHRNVLCRWALCRSLAEPSRPPALPPRGEPAVDIAWRLVAGNLSELWWLLFLTRLHDDGLPWDQQTTSEELHRHIARGVLYLAGDSAIKDVTSLPKLALGAHADR